MIERKAFATQDDFSRAIFDHCRRAKADLVVMGGFLKRITIPEDFAHRVVNIHPALVPAFCGEGFYGHRVHEAVLEYGAKLSGCTVHFADNQYDHGPVILQRAVPVLDDDTPETLAARVFAAECEAYPEAIRLIAAGRVCGRRPPGEDPAGIACATAWNKQCLAASCMAGTACSKQWHTVSRQVPVLEQQQRHQHRHGAVEQATHRHPGQVQPRHRLAGRNAGRDIVVVEHGQERRPADWPQTARIRSAPTPNWARIGTRWPST